MAGHDQAHPEHKGRVCRSFWPPSRLERHCSNVSQSAANGSTPRAAGAPATTKERPSSASFAAISLCHPRFGGRLVNAMGLRADESAARARKTPWKRSDRNSRVGQSPHWAYAAGMSKLSFSFCILASRADLRRAAELRPGLYREYVDLDRPVGHTLSPTRTPLPQLTGVPVEPAAKPHSAPATTCASTVAPLLPPVRRLWFYVRDDAPFGGPEPPAALFRYSRTRSGDHPVEHLRGFACIPQADAYAGYKRLYGPDRFPGVGHGGALLESRSATVLRTCRHCSQQAARQAPAADLPADDGGCEADQ